MRQKVIFLKSSLYVLKFGFDSSTYILYWDVVEGLKIYYDLLHPFKFSIVGYFWRTRASSRIYYYYVDNFREGREYGTMCLQVEERK